MSGEILLRADEARGMANDVRTAADNAISDINSLRGKLGALADSFRGQTADAWDAKYQEWHQGAEQMLQGLDGLGEFLTSAADAIESTDSQLAGGLGG